MKGKIIQEPIPMLPNLQNHFEVEIDASGYAMGEIFMQGGRLIYYHSGASWGSSQLPYL
jgi:hypothetical protein